VETWELSAAETSRRVRAGELSAREAAEAALARIEAVDPSVRAFLRTSREDALARAEAVDAKRARGEALGLLAGVPVALKDNLCWEGHPTSCASRILENWRAPYTAFAVERVLAEDGVPVGQTNMDEFAMGSSTEHSAWGATRNPWDLARAPGGSSGGSAAAVAAGEVALALGSDTGGSIRQPAAFCGVVGVKPTYGRVSRYGLVAFASSLDQIGPFARTIEDAATLLATVGGHDGRDSTSVSGAPPFDLAAALDAGAVKGLRLGLPKEFFIEGLDPAIESAVREAAGRLEGAGARIEDISLPHTSYAVPVYYVVATAECSTNLARYDGVHYGHRSAKAEDLLGLYTRTRAEGFGAEVKRRIMLGTYALSSGYYDAYYLKALKVRALLARDFDRAFEKVDLVLCPTTPTTAFELGARLEDPLSMYLSDVFTISANLAGLPALSVPCALAGSLPVGLQFIAPRFEEARMFAAARAVEETSGLAGRLAPLERAA